MPQTIKRVPERVNCHSIRSIVLLSWGKHLLQSVKAQNDLLLPKWILTPPKALRTAV